MENIKQAFRDAKTYEDALKVLELMNYDERIELRNALIVMDRYLELTMRSGLYLRLLNDLLK